jgi:protocatechuate 3,4-dioxygenase beta subunit
MAAMTRGDRTDAEREHDGAEEHDLGLAHDLPVLLSRRRALLALSGGIGAVLVGCGSDGASTTTAAQAPTTTPATGTTAASPSTTAAVPEETAGPFPGDGSNGPNVLAESGVVRRDITRSFGDASGVAEGVPTTIELRLIDVAGGGGPLKGAAVYLWHCDAAGRYSLYDGEIASENYLRGVQVSDADGNLAFDTVFPAAYPGRWPHAHFEVYESAAAAAKGDQKLRTSQLAIPQATCEQVYATSGYDGSAEQLARTPLDADMVFSDGYASQLAKASGSVKSGITLRMNVGV